MSNSTNSKNKVKLNNKNWKIEKLKNWKKKIKIQSCDLSALTRTGPVNARTCPVNARLSIALTSVNLPCQQFKSSDDSTLTQSGPQRSGWLEAAWPFASLNLPVPYLPTRYGLSEPRRLGRRAAAAVEPAKQVQLELTNSSLLTSWFQSFWVSSSKCFHNFRSWSLKKAEVSNLRPCSGRCTASRRGRGTR